METNQICNLTQPAKHTVSTNPYVAPKYHLFYNLQCTGISFFLLEMHMGMLNYILIKFQKVMSFVCHKLIIRILFI